MTESLDELLDQLTQGIKQAAYETLLATGSVLFMSPADQEEAEAAAKYARLWPHERNIEISPAFQAFIAGCEWLRGRLKQEVGDRLDR